MSDYFRKIIAWLQTFRGSKGKIFSRGRKSEAESLALTLHRAADSVRFAARDDEAIAREANDIVRRGLDKRCIAYEDYKRWRQKNPTIFTAVTGSDNQLIGFFDVFPLTDESARGLLDGEVHERSLGLSSILPCSGNDRAKYLYTASIMLNPEQAALSPLVAKEVLLLNFAEHLSTTFPPNGVRVLFAYAHTAAGERLLRNAGFTNTRLPEHAKQGSPLYELSPDAYGDLARDFEGMLGRKGARKRLRSRPRLSRREHSLSSCFISYSHEDKGFARSLHDRLQERGTRCWLDEHQLLPGDDLHNGIDRGIRLWDKVLLCASKASLTSWWVDGEINRAFLKEVELTKERGEKVLALIPLNLDGFLFSTDYKSGKKAEITSRVAANFVGWEQDHALFDAELEKVIRALHTGQNHKDPPTPAAKSMARRSPSGSGSC